MTKLGHKEQVFEIVSWGAVPRSRVKGISIAKICLRVKDLNNLDAIIHFMTLLLWLLCSKRLLKF